MTKKEWLQICRLYQEWCYRSLIDDASDEWIKENMPDDNIFDDGRIEFFEKNFKKEPIDKDKLQKAMDEVNVQVSSLLGNTKYRKMNEFEKQIFMTGYRKAMEG